jgi:hypothetical protein
MAEKVRSFLRRAFRESTDEKLMEPPAALEAQRHRAKPKREKRKDFLDGINKINRISEAIDRWLDWF